MANQVCIIETNKIVNGTDLMKGNTDLVKWDSDLSSLNIGRNMFRRASLTSFNSVNLSNLTDGFYMFYGTSLTSFNIDLSKLTNGMGMFRGTPLTSFSGDLSKLTNGSQMFMGTNLTSFSVDISSIVDCSSMFQACSDLTSFNGGDLSNLTNGSSMFFNVSLTSFSSDLSSLTNGDSMFANAYSLTSFDSDLSSLTNGDFMFYYCKLNTDSIKCIAETIKNVTGLTNSTTYPIQVNKKIRIDIGNSTPTTEEQGYLNTIASKGWTVYVNGSAYTPTGVASVMTLDEDGNEVKTPIPYYAKPIPSDEEHATYTDKDGNYFNIVGAQFNYGDDLSTYGMFTCEEDAALNMRLTKIDK